MEMQREQLVGGWRAPCARFDYRGLESSALREQRAIGERLELLKRQRPKTAEGELIRRREVRMLTDMYYEQRSNARMFSALAAEKRQ